MRIGFYSPYFDSLGGGERYLFTLASHWSIKHAVYLFCDDPGILDKAQERFQLDLSRVSTTSNIFKKGNLLYKLWKTKDYDLIFSFSDGSIPASLSKHNILLFQMPFQQLPYNHLKLWRYDAIVCYSNFVKRNLDPRYGRRTVAIYPPVPRFAGGNKTKLILNVGRFSLPKKQDILIKAFKLGYDRGYFKNWKLVFIGGLIESDRGYLSKLQQFSKGYPILLIANGSFSQLQDLYRHALIYWHAAGYAESDPKFTEHFGISTAEAMSAGCVPLVYKAGGQLEIITDEVNGFFWTTIEELVQKTNKIINDINLQKKIVAAAEKRSKDFDEVNFFTAFDKLLDKLS